MKNTKMKIALMTVVLVIGGFTAYGQIELPQPSPTATFNQKVGLTDVTITYSRPGVKDRKIFGGLVPYNKLWRTGANMATKFEFSDDVTIAGKELPAGAYALFTIPGKEEWTIILNNNWQQGGTGNYSKEEDALRFKVKPKNFSEKVETFLINIGNVRDKSADIQLIWEETLVEIPLEVEYDDKVMASIEESLEVNPGSYFQAAVYYHETDRDLNQALSWIDKAIEQYEKDERNVYWVYRQKALILADMEKYKDAIAAAEKSKSQAEKAGNDQYIKYNKESISEWKKLL